ncbi:LysR family transcriptional regulator substrate-binding protein [Streptomyces sp. NPDC012769]|uniref:LysR family transcriptional regulator substrate-binding protein n=1 Tax=Streptomyces sp. NPDC012769 TaxID=3364848 RepID=UPI0036C599E6
MSALQDREIDAAFAYLPVPDGLRVAPLVVEPRLVCVAASDPPADGRPSVTLAEPAGRPVVGQAPGTFRGAREFWAADPRPDGEPVRYTDHGVSRFESLLSVVSFGGAVAFVPSAAARLCPRPDLRYLPVPDLTECTLAVVWPTAGGDRPALTALADVCAQVHRLGLLAGSSDGPLANGSARDGSPHDGRRTLTRLPGWESVPWLSLPVPGGPLLPLLCPYRTPSGLRGVIVRAPTRAASRAAPAPHQKLVP